MQHKYKDVLTGEVVCVPYGPDEILCSLAIGSCIVVMAYDYRTGIAAMAHIMLPGIAPDKSDNPLRYTCNALDFLIRQLENAKWSRSDTVFTLVGAGNVLIDPNDTICRNNIRSVTDYLAEMQITVKASVLGGFHRKAAYLEAQTGKMSYTCNGGELKMLWPLD
ncbi:MAG: chemotaxis protein CheD [Sedimentisphaerales bacterium]|nr:chemotaxis protein CheD [Sedimentisphaerales bacterium]